MRPERFAIPGVRWEAARAGHFIKTLFSEDCLQPLCSAENPLGCGHLYGIDGVNAGDGGGSRNEG